MYTAAACSVSNSSCIFLTKIFNRRCKHIGQKCAWPRHEVAHLTGRHLWIKCQQTYYRCRERNIAKSQMVHTYWPRFARSSLPLGNYTHAVPNNMQTVYLLVSSTNRGISVCLVHAKLFIKVASLYCSNIYWHSCKGK